MRIYPFLFKAASIHVVNMHGAVFHNKELNQTTTYRME